MKNLVVIFILFSLCPFYAQEKISYNSKFQKVEFTISEEEYYSKYSSQNIQSMENQNSGDIQEIIPNAVILKRNIKGRFASNRMALSGYYKNVRAEKVEPVLIYRDGTKQIVDGQITIKIKPNANIHKIISQWNFDVKQNEYDNDVYLLTSPTYTTEIIFNIVNQLQRNKDVEFAEPNFMRLVSLHTTDPFFSEQWAYRNSRGANIGVEKAWNISNGSGVKVAVLDEGVDLSHLDLKQNLLSGYDTTGNNSNGDVNRSSNDAHGTACAGIISAVANNGIGIAGISYNSKIIPIRIAHSNGFSLNDYRRSWITSDTWIANGINWAWRNGAEILNNSWGGGSYSQLIANAIDDATYKGRLGKGCVVVFSAGNQDKSYVSFPAHLDNVIAVGAMSMCNQRKSPISCDGEKWGSDYGDALDIVAPGVQIYTTDIMGTNGYNSSGDYAYFNGTSSAAPHVAGVAALILSVNPNLTGKEVRDIIEKTAQKVGGYKYQKHSNRPNGTWNNEMGYGLVDAYEAVKKAECSKYPNPSLETDAMPWGFCKKTRFYIKNLPDGSKVDWKRSGFSSSVVDGKNPSEIVIDFGKEYPARVEAEVTTPCGEKHHLSIASMNNAYIRNEYVHLKIKEYVNAPYGGYYKAVLNLDQWQELNNYQARRFSIEDTYNCRAEKSYDFNEIKIYPQGKNPSVTFSIGTEDTCYPEPATFLIDTSSLTKLPYLIATQESKNSHLLPPLLDVENCTGIQSLQGQVYTYRRAGARKMYVDFSLDPNFKNDPEDPYKHWDFSKQTPDIAEQFPNGYFECIPIDTTISYMHPLKISAISGEIFYDSPRYVGIGDWGDVWIRFVDDCKASKWQLLTFKDYFHTNGYDVDKNDGYSSPILLRMSPNPARGKVHLWLEKEKEVFSTRSFFAENKILNNNQKNEFKVDIYNMQGFLVRSIKGLGQMAEISVENLPTGVYIVHFTQNGQIHKDKLIIE